MHLEHDSLPGQQILDLIRKYSMQLMEPDLVPEHMDTLFRNGELVTKNVNHVSKRPFSETTCSACFEIFGTKHHGHNHTMPGCPCKHDDETAEKKIKKDRIIRKVGERTLVNPQ